MWMFNLPLLQMWSLSTEWPLGNCGVTCWTQHPPWYASSWAGSRQKLSEPSFSLICPSPRPILLCSAALPCLHEKTSEVSMHRETHVKQCGMLGRSRDYLVKGLDPGGSVSFLWKPWIYGSTSEIHGGIHIWHCVTTLLSMPTSHIGVLPITTFC